MRIYVLLQVTMMYQREELFIRCWKYKQYKEDVLSFNYIFLFFVLFYTNVYVNATPIFSPVSKANAEFVRILASLSLFYLPLSYVLVVDTSPEQSLIILSKRIGGISTPCPLYGDSLLIRNIQAKPPI